MSIRMVTYPGEVRTALNDAVVYNAAVSTGCLSGCDCSVSGNDITIANGFLLIQGRLIEVSSETVTIPFASSGTILGRIYVRADLQNTQTPVQLLYSTGSTLPDLQQSSNINIDGGVYDLELCTFTVGTTSITDLKKTVAMVNGEYSIITETGTSANDYTSPGIYTFSSTYAPSNLPSGVEEGWFFVVGGRGTSVRQILLQGSAVESKQYNIYTRTGVNGTWTGWARFITEDEVFYKPGERVTLHFGTGGYITGGTADCRFRSPWNKLLGSGQGITGVKLISGNIVIRQNNKYLANGVDFTDTFNSAGIGGYPEISPNGLWMTVTKRGGWGGVNNEAVGVTGSCVIEFT